MFTTMRSQDVWWGMPYDIFTATIVQELMAHWIGCEVGTYSHTVDSLHIYESFFERAGCVAVDDSAQDQLSDEFALKWHNHSTYLEAVRGAAVEPGEPWYDASRALLSYRLWKSGAKRRASQEASSLSGWLGYAMERWYGLIERESS